MFQHNVFLPSFLVLALSPFFLGMAFSTTANATNDWECGSPNVDPAVDEGLFIWHDCDSQLVFQLTGIEGKGSAAVYGNFLASRGITSLNPHTLESSDLLRRDAFNFATFNIRTSHPWNDSFSLGVSDLTASCVQFRELSDDMPIYFGPDRRRLAGSFDPQTLEPCNAVIRDCLAPKIDPGNERALFLWYDCIQRLHIVATGAQAGARYIGEVTLTHPENTILSASSIFREPNDVYDPSSGTSVFFDLKVGGPHIDEIIVKPRFPDGCIRFINRSVGTKIYTGDERIQIAPPATLGGSNCDGDEYIDGFGEPWIDPSEEEGLFVWQDGGGKWWLMVTGGESINGSVRYKGSIKAETTFPKVFPYSIEPLELGDELTTDHLHEVSFDLTTAHPWSDRFGIVVRPGESFCVTVDSMPESFGRYLGVDRVPMGFAFNPVTREDCSGW